MDRVLSARIDESILHRITLLAQQLHTSKKNVLEMAIKQYAQTIEAEKDIDVLKQTFGAWKRKESADELIKKAKKKFGQSMRRYQK